MGRLAALSIVHMMLTTGCTYGPPFNLCDLATLKVDRVWQQDRPARFRSGFGPWVGPWTGDGIYFSVRGYTTTTTDPTPFHRVDYRLGREGLDSGVTVPPRPIRRTRRRPSGDLSNS